MIGLKPNFSEIMNLTNKKIYIGFVTICVLAYVIFVVLVFQPNTKKSATPTAATTGKFNKLAPGTTTESSLTGLYGKPAVVEKNGSINTLFYNSSALYQYDYVWTKNGKVIAVKEVLPEKTTKEQASMNLGTPDKTYYDSVLPDDIWLIFLKKGVAIKTAENIAYSLVRFEPQLNDSFLTNIAPLVGITTRKIEIEDQGEFP